MVPSNRQTVECPSRTLWVGIGCKRGTPKEAIEQAIQDVFQSHQLSESAIAGIATIDTKANEPGLIEFCRDRTLPLRYFSAEALRSVAIPNPSGAIAAAVGTPSVAEAAAFLASWEAEAGEAEGAGGSGLQCLPPPPYTPHPIPKLFVPKQIVRNLGQTGFVTVAVARSLNGANQRQQITLNSAAADCQCPLHLNA